MAITKYTWPVENKTAVCALQSGAAAGDLILNGSMVSIDIPNQVSFISNNLSRSVSISSTADNSAVAFSITGFQNGAYVTENIPIGPNNETVYGNEIFDQIIRVTADGAFTDITVGTGKYGYLPLIPINIDTVINFSASIIVPTVAVGSITYSMFQSLDDINTNFTPYENQTSLFPVLGLTGMTMTGLGNEQNMTNYVILKVEGSNNPATDSLELIFIQG
jgi:hypothetical protein